MNIFLQISKGCLEYLPDVSRVLVIENPILGSFHVPFGANFHTLFQMNLMGHWTCKLASLLLFSWRW